MTSQSSPVDQQKTGFIEWALETVGGKPKVLLAGWLGQAPTGFLPLQKLPFLLLSPSLIECAPPPIVEGGLLRANCL